MNRWQIAQQARYQLREAVWEGSVTKVFAPGSVLVTAKPQAKAAAGLIMPAAFVRPMNATADPEGNEEPGLWRGNFNIALFVAVPGDMFGEAQMIGAHRQGQTDSDGRGILELEEELLRAVELLNRIDGVSIQFKAAAAPEPQIVDGLGYALWVDYGFEADFTRARQYHTAENFIGADAGSGNASLTWDVPPDRFDRYEVVLRRAAGSTAPASATAGTGVTLASVLATSVTDDPGAGTFSYALFGGYDEFKPDKAVGDLASDRFSDSRTLTVTVT